ncbi:MAG: OmpH family outer membrane protein [Saprospiraceae bacterium]|nr:OmpH family outer membrane protein [Saprospiraceae bacterium]
MKINILTLAFSLICSLIGLDAQTQKFGYVNSQALLSEIPEVKQADANLQAFQSQLEKKGQQMVQELEGKYRDLQRREQSGEISPKALEEEAKMLKLEEAKLGEYEQEMQKQLMAKRQEVLQPILDKINEIIKQVAKENQFTYIFDSSSGILLFAEESMDVTKLVKTKLGI